MGVFARRFRMIAVIAAVMSGLGSAQRWWYRHCVAEAEKAEREQQAISSEYKAQLVRVLVERTFLEAVA